jgi:hypothetical protein
LSGLEVIFPTVFDVGVLGPRADKFVGICPGFVEGSKNHGTGGPWFVLDNFCIGVTVSVCPFAEGDFLIEHSCCVVLGMFDRGEMVLLDESLCKGVEADELGGACHNGFLLVRLAAVAFFRLFSEFAFARSFFPFLLGFGLARGFFGFWGEGYFIAEGQCASCVFPSIFLDVDVGSVFLFGFWGG